MSFDRSILKKIRYHLKEEKKYPVAYWAIQALLDYIDELEKTMEFYANGDWYHSDIDPVGEIVKDNGKKARKILSLDD